MKNIRDKLILIIALAVIPMIFIALPGCFHKTEPELCQSYTGVLPAASSIGIETTITFLPGGKFTEKDVYIGEKDGIFKANGTYTRNRNTLTLISDRGEKNFYALEKGQIRRLDMNANPIVGNLADFYVLKCLKTF